MCPCEDNFNGRIVLTTPVISTSDITVEGIYPIVSSKLITGTTTKYTVALDINGLSIPAGLKGDTGNTGSVGNFVAILYQWSITKPLTPNTPAPTNWNASPGTNPNNGSILWFITAELTSPMPRLLISSWSEPVSLSGIKGDIGLSGNNGTNGTNGTNGSNGTNGLNGRSTQVFVQTVQPTGTIYAGDIWIAS